MSELHDAFIEIATKEEIDAGIALTLERLGVTYDELAAMGAADEFPSERARLTWFLIAPEPMRPEGPHGRNTSLGTDPPTP